MTPRAEYEGRLRLCRMAHATCETTHRRIGNARLLVFVLGGALAWFAGWIWILPAAVALVALVVYHQRVLAAMRLARRAISFYERGIARLDHNWQGKGESGDRFRDPSHPYGDDLDLFGTGSLFELLCAARTPAGQATLAGWLLHPATPGEIDERQKAVDELRSRLDLREDLAVLGEDLRSGVHARELAEWSERPPIVFPKWLRVAAPLMASVALVLLGALVFTLLLDPRVRIVLVVFGLIEGAVVLRHRRRIMEVIHSVEEPGQDLALLSQVLHRLEAESFTSPRLERLRLAIQAEGTPASFRIARLNTLMELIDSRDNVFVRVCGPLLLWTTQLAFAVERWRAENGRFVRGWIDAVGEIEALSSLAGYAYEHPDDPFPVCSERTPVFEAEAVGHPLLPESKCVRNDVALDSSVRVLIVSGSNMSGKSTLLRTVGINAVLAMAGAPVRAKRLELSGLSIGAAIRVNDSLAEGTSRFYAEITRLRQIIELPQPALFLLDELLHGTNSHDRRIGGAAVVKSLVQRGGIGLVTTHDLALAEIAESLAPHAGNVHFEDHLENGRISFDYTMRPGVVEKSNALELMRAVGIDV